MKKKYQKFVVLGLASLGILLLANSGGSPGGRTGSATDQGRTCATQGGCHAGGGTVLSQEMISTTIPAEGYVPGMQYTITLSPAFDGAGRYGFEMMVEDASGSAKGTFTNNSDGNIKENGLRITHKFASSTGGDTKTWNLDWTAPSAGTGDLVIFASVLAANGNGATSGDRLILDTLILTENTKASVNYTFDRTINLFPNPVHNMLHISGTETTNSLVTITDINGKTVISEPYTKSVDVSILPAGTYVLLFVNDTKTWKKKFIKR